VLVVTKYLLVTVVIEQWKS